MNGRPKGRKFKCPRCGRMIGEHGYSNTGALSYHKCPHGRVCAYAFAAPFYTDCVECQGARRSEVEP